MSRIGKKPLIIPDKVEVKIVDRTVVVKGPLGELKYSLLPHINLELQDKQIIVTRTAETKIARSVHGLTSRLLNNMLEGVSKGYSKELEIVGVGYKVALKGKDLEMFLGFSHPVIFPCPEGIKFKVEKNNIVISGIDKQLVGETSAKIRDLKKPEPYKGKGIKYIDEYIRRKSGKMAASASSGS